MQTAEDNLSPIPIHSEMGMSSVHPCTNRKLPLKAKKNAPLPTPRVLRK